MTLAPTALRLAAVGAFATALAGCPVGPEFEPGPPEVGVVPFGLPAESTASVSIALDGGAATASDVTANGVVVVLADDLAEGTTWEVTLTTAPAGATCTLSDNATGTIADRNVYVDLVCSPTSAEVCNGLDDDGNGEVDEGLDADGDGVTPCGADGQFGTADDDCNDDDSDVLPGADEVCGNEVDDDCDDATLDAADADGDGVDCATDCDDADPTRAPGLPERCNGVDDDCDGEAALGELDDFDGDGLGDACDNLFDIPCDTFSVFDVQTVTPELPGAVCLAYAAPDAMPEWLAVLGLFEYSGLAHQWSDEAFELFGAGWIDGGKGLIPIAVTGCNDEFSEGSECADNGRPLMPLEPIVSEEQAWACSEVAVAGCGTQEPLVLIF